MGPNAVMLFVFLICPFITSFKCSILLAIKYIDKENKKENYVKSYRYIIIIEGLDLFCVGQTWKLKQIKSFPSANFEEELILL